MTYADPRLTMPTLKVLKALLASETELAGADIAKESKLASGSLYPILMRLEAAGWLSSQWEESAPQMMGRPRRRLYKVTGLGMQKARSAFRELEGSNQGAVADGGLQWV